MRFSVLFSLIALIAIVNCQDMEVKYVIDTFQAVTPAIISIIPAGGVPAPASAFTRDGSIMGGERDLQLTVGSGDSNLILTTGVSGGSYTAATPNEARGNSLYQLDGIDGTMNLNADGLFGTANNNFLARNANSFRIVHETDLPGRIFFRIYSGSVSAVCTYTLITIGDDSTHVAIIPYSDFGGSCDFSNVGAVEIFIAMDDNIDVLISEFSTWGPEETCVCNCPAFTCNDLDLDLDGGEFQYYFTSDFGRFNSGTFNPTTDLSSINFTVSQFTSLFTSGVSTIFTTNPFSTIGTSNINTSFSISNNTSDDDDDSSNSSSSNTSDDDDDSSNSSSNTSDDDDDNNSGSSSSSSNDASVMTVATVAVLVLAVLF